MKMPCRAKRLLPGLLLIFVLVSANASSTSAAHFTADFSAVLDLSPSRWGTNVWWTNEDAELWTARWAELGPSLVRIPVSHALVEPENDNADPSVIEWDGFHLSTPISASIVTTRTFTYQSWFEALRDQPNIDILIYFSYLAPWLSDNASHLGLGAPYPPNDLAEYREFVDVVLLHLVETVKFPPDRIAIEAMNEPDLACGADPVVPCFWQNWTQDDIAEVLRVTYEAIQAVDAGIPLVGVAECCGTSVVRDLLDNYAEGAYLDGLSYHYYSPLGYDLNAALGRASDLAPYGRPVYLDEYGSLEYQSEGMEGGLWHSWALTTLWEAGIAPLQYPISEWPLLGEPYDSMGLFQDWTGHWERKPSYWVHANFFAHLGGSHVISHAVPSGIDAVVGRRLLGSGEAEVAFWLTNRGSVTLANQDFAVHNFVSETATLHIYDNLVGPTPVLTTTVTGSPLVFSATLPAYSSRTVALVAEDWIAARLFLPLAMCRYLSS